MSQAPISRWSDAAPYTDESGRVVLGEREPMVPRDRPDNRMHTVLPGDTLAALAGLYFAPLPRACGYWWAIAEYQPEPIVDPTEPLAVGRVLVVPSLDALESFLQEAA
ncbi:MAG: hypothetical protein HS111_09765 [Kofleriaceae bacterium]|nr:hypothetical protein [Kofleriaceae bacterium]